MLRRITAVLAIATVVGGAAIVRADAATPTYREYVALGDSWSADVFTTFPPTTQYTPLDCAQSSTDYPHQIAALLHIPTFRDATCGSATTVEMTQPQALPLGGTNPPQFNRLTPTTDLVTLGIGGNDIGLAGDVGSCLNLLPAPLGTSCKATFTAGGDQVSKAITATAPKIATTLQQIRARAPHARILLVNYLNGIPANGVGCWPIVPIWNVDIAYLQAKFVQMNAMLATVAHANHVQLADTYTPTLGHDVCQAPTVRYAEGLIPISLNPIGLAFPFHPNGAGAEAQTQAVYAAVQHP